ncbi:ras-related protein rab-5c [Plakobranchus ocellatus]|uniref:Ras-related protein rab-5c n=1 Tax=Plakobranchus ocellatus TaxID=259542 RepID=A0AAV3YJV8_9GAST|nr:ras-related protein rab-5c [Plakobranchus ocellatus]
MPSLATKLTVLVLILAVYHIRHSHGQTTISKCTINREYCGCTTDKGVINLTRYKDSTLKTTDPTTAYSYSWNPCQDVKIGSETAACVQDIPYVAQYDCGTHDSTETSVQDGSAVFKLVSADSKRRSTVICKCTTYTAFVFDKEESEGVYEFTLNDDVCCPDPSIKVAGSSDGLSGGSILLIIALVVVLLYLVVGVAVQVGVRKAEGRERIPNVNFWSALPGLIAAGIRFTFTCGKSGSYNEV